MHDPVHAKILDEHLADKGKNFFKEGFSLSVVRMSQQKTLEAADSSDVLLGTEDKVVELGHLQIFLVQKRLEIRRSQVRSSKRNDGLAVVYGDVFRIARLARALLLGSPLSCMRLWRKRRGAGLRIVEGADFRGRKKKRSGWFAQQELFFRSFLGKKNFSFKKPH